MERLGISAVIIEDKKGLKKNSLLGNEVFQEIPFLWNFVFDRDLAVPVLAQDIVYEATGSLISGSTDDNQFVGNHEVFIWSASAVFTGDPDEMTPIRYLITNGAGSTAVGSKYVQKSSSAVPETQQATFPKNGDFLEQGVFYKWKLELNAKPTSPQFGQHPLQLITTSSMFMKFGGPILGNPFAGTGDVTLDGSVNVLDVVQAVQHIIDGAQNPNSLLTGDSFEAGDMNSDGEIDVLDVVAIINIILSGRSSIDERGFQLGYNSTKNKLFVQRQKEKQILQNFITQVSESGVRFNNYSSSLGNLSEVSSSLQSLITSSAGLLLSASAVTSVPSIQHDRRIIPKLGDGFGYNFITSYTGSKNV